MNLSSLAAGVRQFAATTYRSYFSLPYVQSANDVCQKYRRTDESTRALDLGCGKTPRNAFAADDLFGVDVDYGIDESHQILACDLGVEALPFPDQHFDYVTAFDLFEHIPRLTYDAGNRRQPFIDLMSEIHRVLKPGGLLLSDTPAFPRESAYVDPTHVNVITIDTFRLYFAHPHNWATRYGFVGDFDLKEQAWCGENLISILARR